jgi:energy-coupling factor transport system permease protein
MVLGSVLTLTTAPIDMTNALSSLLKPLKILRVPVEDVAMIISVAISFIPTLLEETDMIKKAQTARGARFESKKLIERALSYLPLLVPIFLAAFRRADELSMAMEARGYRNARSRTKKAREPFRIRDFTALASSIFICFAQVYIW